jgi:hypothetical protein
MKRRGYILSVATMVWIGVEHEVVPNPRCAVAQPVDGRCF